MSETETVAIDISTYNGEKYLADQITSILNQTYQNIHVYIRDDGSTDKTVDIITAMVTNDERVTFVNEGNITNMGVINSFVNLLQHSAEKYVMFCDQDDVWLENKVADTLDLMKKNENPAKPRLVHTDLMVVDNELNDQGLMYGNEYANSFKDVLFSNSVTGCTMMLNESLKNMILDNPIDKDQIVMHDWWFAAIAATFGSVEFGNFAPILYRQHGDNTFGADVSKLKKFKRLFNLDSETERFKLVLKQDSYLLDVFGDQMDTDKKSQLIAISKMTSGSASAFKNLKTLMNYKIRKSSLKGTVFMWFILTFNFKKVR